uniref:ABC transporter domain-containing protein n=1 Tax=Steinernema glaseri TaxID=37863 RepID=A0A1I8AJW0_9BILA
MTGSDEAIPILADCAMEPCSTESSMISLKDRRNSQSTIVSATTLTWSDICVRPTLKAQQKSQVESGLQYLQRSISHEEGKEAKIPPRRGYILKDVYGLAEPGEILALMGASGAGKTTLLNVLTMRNLADLEVSGSIRVNGRPISRTRLRQISAYCQQDEMFVPTLTVKEHLAFMAALKMGRTHSCKEQKRRVQAALYDLELDKCKDTIIGNPLYEKSLSGGERKRLSFASEILTSPPILFCDEPTSGLDSFMAKQVVQILKNLAHRKRMTIIFTIHQPASQVFSVFDKLSLMAEGRVIFTGPPDLAETMFDEWGFPLPMNFNPADHYISTLAIRHSSEALCRKRVNMLSDSFLACSRGKEVLELCEGGKDDARSTVSSYYGEDRHIGYKATYSQQLRALLQRSFKGITREPELFKFRLIETLLVGLIIGSLYFQTPVNQSTVNNINGLLYTSVANINFMYQFEAVNFFCLELPIFLREHHSGLYRVDTYFLAKNLAEIPQYIVFPFSFCTLVYWVAGLDKSFTAYAIYTFTGMLVANIAVSFSYFVSCVFGSVKLSMAMLPMLVVPMMTFGGFYINSATIPVYFLPLRFISYFNYAFEVMTINQWTRVDHIGGCSTSNSTSPCFEDGADVIASLSYDPSHFWRNLVLMVGMVVILRTLAFSALYIRAWRHK